MKDDFLLGQKVEIHPSFDQYSLDGNMSHEAGFDSLMTGVVWFKMMTLLGKQGKFPGTESILKNDQMN